MDPISEVQTKVCSHCGMTLPVSMFYKSSRAKDGLQNCCKQCSNESSSASRAKRIKAKKEAKDFIESTPHDTVEVQTPSGKVLRRVLTSADLANVPSNDLISELKRRGYVWSDMWIKKQIPYSKF